MWNLNDEGATPLLPRRLKVPPRSLKPGCWLVQLVPFFSDDVDPRLALYPVLHGWTLLYTGTLRVDGRHQEGVVYASGDLYIRHAPWAEPGSKDPPPLAMPQLAPNTEIPVFPRRDYAFYFTVQDLERTGTGLRMSLAFSPFDSDKNTWGPGQILTAELGSTPHDCPPDWSPADPEHYLKGEVKNDQGTTVAAVEIRWISEYLREASIGVAVAPDLKLPAKVRLDKKTKTSLKSVFEKVGWKINLAKPVTANITAEVWQPKDLHATMLMLQSGINFDRTWRYHVLVAPRFVESTVYGFGMGYDGGALDTDLVPREGLVIAAKSRFPDDPRFGDAAGKMLQEVPAAAFCDLMHELGHAMGLVHRFRGQGFMQELVYFASPAAPLGKPFPHNLKFYYDPQDEMRLRHHPDPWVRSGGVRFGAGYTSTPVPETHFAMDVSAELGLSAAPLCQVVLLGAPVRLQLRLTNLTKDSLPGPAALSLSKGSVSGQVIAPNGEVRTFWAASPIDYHDTVALDPGSSRFHGETLWRGPEGALFPTPGLYRIALKAGWVAPGGVAITRAHCDVLIAAPRNERHEEAALRLLACEDLALLLVFRAVPDGGTAESNRRIAAAAEVLADCLEVPELRPSLAPIQAQLVLDRNLRQATRLVDEESQLTTSEIENLLESLRQVTPDLGRSSEPNLLVATCRRKLRQAVRAGFIDRFEFVRIVGQKGCP